LTPFDFLKCVSNNIQMLPNITNVKFQHLTCFAQLPSRALACSGSPLDCCVITQKNWKTTSLGPFWVFFWVLLCNLIGTNSRERLSHWQVPTRSEYERFALRFNVDMCKAAVYKLYQFVFYLSSHYWPGLHLRTATRPHKTWTFAAIWSERGTSADVLGFLPQPMCDQHREGGFPQPCLSGCRPLRSCKLSCVKLTCVCTPISVGVCHSSLLP